MYELTMEEMVSLQAAMEAAWPPTIPDEIRQEITASLQSGATRMFGSPSGLLIMLAPYQCSPAAMPPLLRARIEVDQAAGDTLQVFIANVHDPDEPADNSPGAPVLLWNASQGLGTVLVQDNNEAAATLQDIWAADVLEFLTLLFEDPGVADSPI